MDLFIQFLPNAVKNLENDPESLRIKKFIYCLTKRRWENDLRVINRYSLDELLLELIRIQPTINRLSSTMYELVKSLNHQDVYASVASTILIQVAPIYNAHHDDIENSQIYWLLKEQASKKKPAPSLCLNLMEVLVKEVIFQELEKLPPNICKLINPEEVAAHALNRLPTLYVTSEKGRIEQQKKARLMRKKIHLVVVESIKTVINDPIRNSTPLKINSIFYRKMPD
jgi:hypothetical protein